jgi:branched-chain amino acid aminotransferase
MIWVGGRIVPDDALRVSVLDRTFEHGLGLFETLRTWNGRAPLLERHLARMKQSASVLQLPYGSVMPPDEKAVSDLVAAEGLRGDVLLRITLTGGTSPTAGATLWMRALPLPAPIRKEGAIVDFGSWWIRAADSFARHKTLNYWSRRQAYENARQMGFDEVLSVRGSSTISAAWEGSRTNLFAVKGDKLMTPPTDGPIVPGVMRGLVLEQARNLALTVTEDGGIPSEELANADEVFLTNSVRGIIPVGRLVIPTTPGQKKLQWSVPGPITGVLSLSVADWIESRGAPT